MVGPKAAPNPAHANWMILIIDTHSPILLGLPGAQILNFSDEGIRPIRYEDTESYQITKLFLEQRESLLNKLFNGAED